MKKPALKIREQDLRQRAEEVLNKLTLDNDITFPKEIKRLLHELQVYRVELEMQNDELHAVQTDLEKSRNRYADLYYYAPVGYITLNNRAEILMLNVTAGHMIGYSRNSLLGRNISEFIGKADKDRFYIFLSHVFSTTQTQTAEIKFLDKKNIPIYVQLEAVQVDEPNVQSTLKQCRVAMLDITERKVAEAQLRERESSLREAQELANVGSWHINLPKGKIIASPQLYTILGLRRSEPIKSDTLLKFVHPEDKKNLRTLYDRIKIDGKPFSATYRVILRDGTERWIYSSNKAELDIFSQVVKISGFIQDITEQKQSTELRIQAEKLEIASNFARTIAHEVRNPLTTVNLSLAMLMNEAKMLENDRLCNYVSTISRNIKRVDQLITQLLYSSRRSESIFTKTHICDILDNALKEASDRIEISGVELEKKYLTDCEIKADVETLTIAFLSLIVNAVEATSANKGKITIITEQRDSQCFVTIRDNGSGIKPSLTKRIFEPFYTTKTDGMGLGLTNTKNIIESNNGQISVESEPGKGTSFIVVFDI
ncbi:MAG: PAS domain S-box protein [Sphingobacteriales bacterium]|nr:MAG: PAS domain S-box protein [Sphingobacteriales bacterium]